MKNTKKKWKWNCCGTALNEQRKMLYKIFNIWSPVNQYNYLLWIEFMSFGRFESTKRKCFGQNWWFFFQIHFFGNLIFDAQIAIWITRHKGKWEKNLFCSERTIILSIFWIEKTTHFSVIIYGIAVSFLGSKTEKNVFIRVWKNQVTTEYQRYDHSFIFRLFFWFTSHRNPIYFYLNSSTNKLIQQSTPYQITESSKYRALPLHKNKLRISCYLLNER